MSYTIEDQQNKMTLIYNKRLGIIKEIGTGIFTLVVYGKEAEDYKLIYDCFTLDKDEFVLNNFALFKVNAETKQLELLPTAIQQYPIAAQ
jgi:hypothetical protein